MQEKGRKKNQEKRIILAFLQEEARILLWVVFFIGIFWLLCFLEDIPQDVTIYTLQLASFTGIAVLIVRFIHYRKRCKTLELLTKDPRDKIEAFPNPDTLSEKLYRQIIGQYERELRKEEQQMDDRYREMVEYYTMWTHQIKTPIAAMHLLLQEEETPVSKELQGELFQVEQYVQMALQYLRMERMNTDLVFEKPTAQCLQGIVDTVSISLNSSDAQKYVDITRNHFGLKSYQAMIDYAKDCQKYVPNVVMTVVDIIGEEEVAACRKVCDDNGLFLRVRPYEAN